jgi:transitional endoplasmic reticulum ATPase
LVESVRRIENLYRLVEKWKSTVFSVNGDPLGKYDVQSVFNTLNDLAACWRKQKRGTSPDENPCRSCTLDCERIVCLSKPGFPDLATEHTAWYSVGDFDGKIVILDKERLKNQLNHRLNEALVLCPFFDRDEVIRRIENLPEKLDPEADGARWAQAYSIFSGKPAWVFPKNIRCLPFNVTFDPKKETVTQRPPVAGIYPALSPFTPVVALPNRLIPAARYADVCGQDAVVEAVRDYAELPLKYGSLFEKVGIKPGRGILLWGPPGNGKTLLSRAVAGESGSHIEIISGPEVLSKWVGESERALRDTFERAKRFAPSVILMDELDALAGSRQTCEFQFQRALVSQLLVLMDGLEDRGRVLIIGTTNRPDDLDPALLRPGRIDRKVFMGPPNRNGRTALLNKLLAGKPVADDVEVSVLADLTKGRSGAEIEHLVNEAGLAAIKEAVSAGTPQDTILINMSHFSRGHREAWRPDPGKRSPLQHQNPNAFRD